MGKGRSGLWMKPRGAFVAVVRGHTPPPRQKVCKVLETNDIRLHFDLTSYAK